MNFGNFTVPVIYPLTLPNANLVLYGATIHRIILPAANLPLDGAIIANVFGRIITKAVVRAGAFMGIRNLEELLIANNKIDRIEDFSLPNAVGRLVLKGNHILNIPSPRALSNLNAEKVWKLFKPCLL